MKKIKQEQLENLKNLTGKLNAIGSEIVGMETRKHALLHMHVESTNELNELKKQLEAEYGRVVINMESGEYEDEALPDTPANE